MVVGSTSTQPFEPVFYSYQSNPLPVISPVNNLSSQGGPIPSNSEGAVQAFVWDMTSIFHLNVTKVDTPGPGVLGQSIVQAPMINAVVDASIMTVLLNKIPGTFRQVSRILLTTKVIRPQTTTIS